MKENSLRPAPAIRYGYLVILACMLIILAACNSTGGDTVATPTAGPTAQPTLASTEPTRGQAVVNSIDVQILESFPVQVNVVARGDLPDSCTQIDEIITQQSSEAFRVAVTTLRQPTSACTQALVPFEQSIPLDVVGLPAGTYNVSVNGVNGSFTLSLIHI